MEKIDKYFVDWENMVFGYGYGTGEEYTLKALKDFMDCMNPGKDVIGYNHKDLYNHLGTICTWLMINTLCREDIITYGSSPRFGWLTEEGKRLYAYLKNKTVAELYNLVTTPTEDDRHFYCNKSFCNCGEVQVLGRCKNNPFF